MRGKLAAEKVIPGLNVTEQDIGNNRLSSCCWLFFSSVPSKPRCKNLMQAWLHLVYQCCASLVSRPLCPFFHRCIVCTTCTNWLHPCMQPCKQGEWGEQVHFPRGTPFGFWRYSSSLDVSLKNAQCIISLHILCLVYTVQPLDNNFIICNIISTLGGRALKRIFNCLWNTNTLYNLLTLGQQCTAFA